MRGLFSPAQRRNLLPLFLILFLPSFAQAHPGLPGHTHGFGPGLAHPLTGLDHICAMVAVGLWAAQRGGRHLWLMPLTFVSVMAVGGLLGMSGMAMPWVESGIVISVLGLGAFIAAAARLSLAVSVGLVGLFAFCHGFAHGAEMPATASGLAFGTGFIISTIFLHLCGIAIALAARRQGDATIIRYAGGAILAGGVYLCFGS